jgi:Protein of unknown function (DUF2637)
MTPPVRTDQPKREKRTLRGWQLAVVVTVIAIVAAVLITYGVAGSYDSLWHLAAAHHVPLPRLNPVGLDGGLIGVIFADIALTWAFRPLGWLRLTARLLAVGTLAANASAGWPDPVAVFLRIFAPALIVIITEAVRAVLLDRAEETRDRIPLGRWLLAFPSTFRMWRRMILWRVNDYGAAVEQELGRRQAVVQLAVHYAGQDWRKEAPGDLVWMLRNGVQMDEAFARVTELTLARDLAPDEPPSEPETSPGDVSETVPKARSETLSRARREARPKPRLEHAPAPALKLAASKSRSMVPSELEPHVTAMLEAYGDVSQAQIKRDLHVSTAKAAEALRLAKRARTVVPMAVRG